MTFNSFETARTLMDLTLSQTIHNFTNIHYVIPHGMSLFYSILFKPFFINLVHSGRLLPIYNGPYPQVIPHYLQLLL